MRRGSSQRRNGKPTLEERTDGELLSLFVAHDEEMAFAVLVERHKPMILRVCRRVLHHEQDAEDTCQAAFLKLWRKADSISDGKKVGNWLHGVAHREAMNVLRSKRRRKKHEAIRVTITQIGSEVEYRDLFTGTP